MADLHQVLILDHIVFLLSLDWFLDHWMTIGLEADEEKKASAALPEDSGPNTFRPAGQ